MMHIVSERKAKIGNSLSIAHTSAINVGCGVGGKSCQYLAEE